MKITSRHIALSFIAAWRKSCRKGYAILSASLFLAMASPILIGCVREPELHLHDGGDIVIKMPIVHLELDVFWDYVTDLGIPYDWTKEWYYGWDDYDKELFGTLGYEQPDAFNIRRYYTGMNPKAPHTQALSNYVNGFVLETSFNWGFWDILAWNDIKTIDGIQSLIFDESTTLDSVTAYTNMTMNSSRYHAPQFTRSFYQPEGLFAAYEQGIDINRNLNDFYYDEERGLWVKNINMLLEPITYIYLTQVIFHNNKGRVVAVEGNANLSGMARSVVLNSGIAGSDAIVVDYNVRFKKDCNMNGESVDIAGGRLMSFGMCNINGTRFAQSRAGVTRADDGIKHYMDVTMQFSNGMDSTLVFDVTDQVQTRYKGGVITVELDMDTVPIPRRKGGSGFDAVVVDYEDGGTHEFEM